MFGNTTIANAFLFSLLILLGCLNCEAESDWVQANVWDLTNQSDLVVEVEVKSVDTNVTVTVNQVFKGEPDLVSLTFSTPPRPSPDQKGFRCPPLPCWIFLPGETWILFFEKVEGKYSFKDGRIHNLAETFVAIQQFQEVQLLTNDMEKVQRLVQIIGEPPGMSSGSALHMLSTLNKSEFLDLLIPVAEQPVYRYAYISLLRDNGNPKATDLLREMLYTESGNNQRQVMLAVGRKDRHNEEISKELLSFLDHTNSVIRSTSVFVLNCRDYRNGFPDIVRALDDPDPAVRASALAWPWYSYVQDRPEVKKKIKTLRKDEDKNVREAARRALAGMSAWYRFWY